MALLLSACPGDDSMSSATASSSGTGTGGSSMSPMTEAPGSASSSLGPVSSSGLDGSGSSTGSGTGPGVEPPCGFGSTLCTLASGKTEPTDCGTVLLGNDPMVWEAAASCAATAAASQEAFKVAFQQLSVDSLIFDGYYGSVGFAYSTGRLYTDTFGDPMLGVYACSGVTLVDNCTPGEIDPCLECADQGEIMALDCVME